MNYSCCFSVGGVFLCCVGCNGFYACVMFYLEGNVMVFEFLFERGIFCGVIGGIVMDL